MSRIKRLVRRLWPNRYRHWLSRFSALVALADLYRLTPNGPRLQEVHRLYLAQIAYRRNLAAEMRRRYPELVDEPLEQRRLMRQSEVKVFSQCGEDGILLHILSKIGAETRTAVEVGAGGYSSNIANLVVTFGWHGVFIDANPQDLKLLETWTLNGRPERNPLSYKLREAWITRDNINAVILEETGGKALDVLSIDIDGNDYWIWEALDAVKPRIVVVEYNAIFGDDRACSTPYSPDFSRDSFHPSGKICGASLPALEKLGRRKGYRLVCCDSWGINAIFMREDLAEGRFDALTAAQAFYDHVQWQAVYGDLRPELPKLDLVDTD